MSETALNFTLSTPPVTELDSAKSLAASPAHSPRNHSIAGLSTVDLARFANDYLRDCDYRMQSPRTIETRRIFIQNLLWFLNDRDFSNCAVGELRQFFHYLQHGHSEVGGRWGKANLTKAVRPITVKDYYINLRCLFNWLVEDGVLEVSPLEKISKPKVRSEQVQPFSQEQIESLLKAARSSPCPKRDEAIVLFLYDTGVRASELCNLQIDDLDLNSRHARVLGKGNKHRLVYFSRETGKVLSNYLRQPKRETNDPVFLSVAGTRNGEALTRSGLLQLIERLGKVAGIKAMKVSPHVFRHSAAIQLLRNGCDVYSLMSLMGHSSLTVCQTYLKLSKSDLENQYRKCSPVDALAAQKARTVKND